VAVAVGTAVLIVDTVAAFLEGESPVAIGVRIGLVMAGVAVVGWYVRHRTTAPSSPPASAGEWSALQERLTRQAFHDPLTGLPNRALFMDRLGQALSRSRRRGSSAALFIDLDDFKAVNDTLGHVEGDLLIALVGGRLTESVRAEDTAARLGGDEFALLVQDADQERAIQVAQRVLSAMAEPFQLTERPVRIGASIGIALTSGRETAEEMVRAADAAMYAAKEHGKNQFAVFTESMFAAAEDRQKLGADIRGAVERGEFEVAYEPVALLPSGAIVGMDSVVRWWHPVRGLLAPDDYVELAEASEVTVALAEWAIGEVCRQARSWQLARPGQAPVSVSVALRATNLHDGGLVSSVARSLEHYELSPELLTLQIAEQELAGGGESAVHRLLQLKSLGVRIAIDDFGTGAASLGHLRRLPADTIKLDRSFVDAGGPEGNDLSLTRAIVRLAHSLGMVTVAKGVDTAAQVARTSSTGCDQAQGLRFGGPQSGDEQTRRLLGETVLSFWVGHEGHELEVIKSVVADFEASRPGLRVQVVGGMQDHRIVGVLNGPEVPNVVSSFESTDHGSYSALGGLADLSELMLRDGINPSQFTDPTEEYTRSGGRRWALPMLADAYGLYSNLGLLREAGATPPRTVDELSALAKRLTRRHSDGSLAVVGFNPLVGFYENTLDVLGHMFGARWFDASGKPCLGSDPAWARLLRWQRELVDWYGHADLVHFGESVGAEFSPANPFQASRLGMVLDGEWRTAFLANEQPDLDYVVTPAPVDARLVDELYGSGYVNGTLVGIPEAAGRREEAWQLVKYLATDDRAVTKLANGMRNLPSTKRALLSPLLTSDPHFQVFLDIYCHPGSRTTPVGASSSAYLDLFTEFALRWQSGQVPDLFGGLRDLDRQIEAQLITSANEATNAARVAATGPAAWSATAAPAEIS
jgi:multiple sugar transport system substrate-binding protein